MGKREYSGVSVVDLPSMGRTHDIRLPVMVDADTKARLERVASALKFAGYDEIDGYGPVIRAMLEEDLVRWASAKIEATGLSPEEARVIIGRL